MRFLRIITQPCKGDLGTCLFSLSEGEDVGDAVLAASPEAEKEPFTSTTICGAFEKPEFGLRDQIL